MPPKQRTRRSAAKPTLVVSKATPQYLVATEELRDTLPQARRGRRPARSNQAHPERSLKAVSQSSSNLHATLPEVEQFPQQEKNLSTAPSRYNLRSAKQITVVPQSHSSPSPPAPRRAPRASKKINPVSPERAGSRSALPSLRPEIEASHTSHIAIRPTYSTAPQGLPTSNGSEEEEEEEEDSPTSDNWYHSRGYLPPREAMPRGNPSRLRNSSEARSGTPTSLLTKKSNQKENIRTVIPGSMGCLEGLRYRNICFEASEDDNDTISALSLGECLCNTTKEEEKNWQLDLQESQISGEATFQRTIMMEIINRHKLGNCLKYSCESTWTCHPMPRKMSKDFDRMALPTPDLTVSFKTGAVIDELRRNRLSDLMRYMCPESLKENKVDRAFPFFSIEVKNAQTASKNNVALRQNFNVASQALHNIYVFMKLAKMEDTFYKHVRFFSATATSSGFHIRSHRAVKVDQEVWLEDDYPLGFDFEEIFSCSEGYTRAKVTGIAQKIFFEYGIKTLLPKLKEAVMTAFKTLREEALSSTSLGKRPAEDVIGIGDSFGSQRRAFDEFRLDGSQESLVGQPISA